MGSSSGGSSGSSSLLTNSCFDEHLLAVMDQKKRKRMLSNRESARRSRMRKHKHLDDLMTEISQLRDKNSHIQTSLSLYTQNHLLLETENSVLRTQMMASECFINPWSSLLMNQPTMASPNMLQYY